MFAQTAWFETLFRDYELFSEQFKKWEFNVYDVADASKQRPLTYVLYELLKKYDLLTTFKVRFPATTMLLIYIEVLLIKNNTSSLGSKSLLLLT